VAWVRVSGAASHENADCIRDFLSGRFEKGWRQFVIDLGECRGIDSTFIGMLYRLATKVGQVDPDGIVEIINPGERNAKSIRKLGLARWLRERELVDANLRMPPCGPIDKVRHAELVLDAHEALIAANEENRSRFCDVVDFLRQELEAQAAGK
jgi:anti-anti-sigma regulatory factor